MAGQSHPWQELKGEEANHIERMTTRSTSASDNGVGNSGAAVKRSAGDEMPIEMDAVTGHATGLAPSSRGTGLGAAETGRDGAVESAAPVGVQYKVYKRRWFGLVQLTLLNVIVSWDVSVVVSLLLALTVAIALVEYARDRRRIYPFYRDGPELLDEAQSAHGSIYAYFGTAFSWAGCSVGGQHCVGSPSQLAARTPPCSAPRR
jgi:hypothetical protein